MSSEPRVRRIVTGHNETGQAVIAADEDLAGAALAEDAGRTSATFFHLWATHEMPVDLRVILGFLPGGINVEDGDYVGRRQGRAELTPHRLRA